MPTRSPSRFHPAVPPDRFLLLLGLALALGAGAIGCGPRESPPAAPAGKADPSEALNRIAETYVGLVLAVGQHDPDYVDAYYGPDEWQARAKAAKKPLAAIREAAGPPVLELEALKGSAGEEIVELRREYLSRQLQSLIARVKILEGAKLVFDEESNALYDAVAPTFPESHFQEVLDRLEQMIPGRGGLADRYERFKRDFIIPKEKLDAVFTAAIEEARKRTKLHIQLPADESFAVEYVTGKPWSGYNWYKGNSRSVIQVNTDLPITIDRAVDLAAHEGYPGHHVYNVLLERHLARERGWVEFTVYALFSPQSLIAEGSANYGIEVAFPGDERIAFERSVLFPLAGLDASRAGRYYEIEERVRRLNYADNEVARRYLAGDLSREQAAKWLATYGLRPLARAERSIRFVDRYRSYVINYNLGKDLVRAYIEARGGTADHPQERWKEFGRLLSSPRLPSGLK